MTTTWRAPLLVADTLTVEVTPQQANILSGLCRGPGSHRISRELGISVNTYKTHASRLYALLGANCAAHAVALACSRQAHVVVTDGRVS